jgi:hypothetical protein
LRSRRWSLSGIELLADAAREFVASLSAVIVTALQRRAGAVVIAAMVGILVIASLTAQTTSGPVSVPRVTSGIPSAPVAPLPSASSASASGGIDEPVASVPQLAGPTPRLDAEPTRIVIGALGVDLPVIRPRLGETYPLCDVAEFLPSYGLPGLPGVTYLYAHARSGMFLPLLEASRIDGGTAMLGKEVRLYSSDGFRRRYHISEVHRRVHDLDVVNELAGDALVLQTSETSRSSGTKLVVVARPTGTPTIASNRAAAPVARPRVCGD